MVNFGRGYNHEQPAIGQVPVHDSIKKGGAFLTCLSFSMHFSCSLERVLSLREVPAALVLEQRRQLAAPRCQASRWPGWGRSLAGELAGVRGGPPDGPWSCYPHIDHLPIMSSGRRGWKRRTCHRGSSHEPYREEEIATRNYETRCNWERNAETHKKGKNNQI